MTTPAERIVIIGGDLAKAERGIEMLGGRHSRREGVEAHAPIADLAGRGDDRFSECAADAVTGKARLDPQALHLAHAGLERAQADAAHHLAADPGDQQPARRWRIAAGQLGQLALEALKAQVDLEPVGVGAKQPPHVGNVLGRTGFEQLTLGQEADSHGAITHLTRCATLRPERHRHQLVARQLANPACYR